MSLILLNIPAFPGNCEIPGYVGCIMCNSFKLNMDDVSGSEEESDDEADGTPSGDAKKAREPKRTKKKKVAESGYVLNQGVERAPGDSYRPPSVGIHDIEITKNLDRVSPKLFQAVFFPPTDEQTATLYVFTPDDSADPMTTATASAFLNVDLVLTIVLSKVNVRSYNLDTDDKTASGEETFTLSFSKLSMTYKSTGKSPTTVSVVVDMATAT
ncbi:MAG: type VI secretion system tube protein Hcp [Azospirillaceae bacterium]|nr:type VI secretion system tube protein Hcp [Azospirillaceae bacterium]